jgi:HlyD family secretion protein
MGPSSGSSTSSFFGITEPKVPFMIAADLEDMEVYAPISQGDIGRVKVGQSASFTVDAFPEVKFEGKVTEINLMPVNVLGATLYPAVIKVRNQKVGQADSPKNPQGGDGDWVLRPGMTVNVDITRDIHKDVWMLPATALTFPLEQQHHITKAAKDKLESLQKLPNHSDWVPVWIMKDKKPWPIFVRIGKDGKLGINDNNHAEILDWDPKEPEITGKLNREDPKTFPQIIIAAPEPKQSIFDKTPFKIS